MCWAANVTNPITYVTQISYLLLLKMLEEWDAQAEQDARDLGQPHHSLFEGEFEGLRWSRFSSDPDNERMLRTVRDLLPRLAEHPKLSQGARQVFTGAALVIPDGASLRRMVDLISHVSFMAQDADVKGDLFEILVDDLDLQKRAAQFCTPRHLIRVITQRVVPKIGETMCDPAAETFGFGIAAYEFIRTANSSPDSSARCSATAAPSSGAGWATGSRPSSAASPRTSIACWPKRTPSARRRSRRKKNLTRSCQVCWPRRSRGSYKRDDLPCGGRRAGDAISGGAGHIVDQCRMGNQDWRGNTLSRINSLKVRAVLKSACTVSGCNRV